MGLALVWVGRRGWLGVWFGVWRAACFVCCVFLERKFIDRRGGLEELPRSLEGRCDVACVGRGLKGG